jgi:hypothetical protein
MTDKPKCNATTKKGSPCPNDALADSEFCFAHSMTPEERSEKARRAQRESARVRRAKKYDATEHLVGASVSRVWQTVREAWAEFGVRDEAPWEIKVALLQTMLVLIGPKLSMDEARECLAEWLPTLPVHPAPQPEDVYRVARAQWRSASLRWSPLRGLFHLPYPPTMYAEWEDPEHVNEAEPFPEYSDEHQVTEHLTGLPTHVRVVAPKTADEVVVPKLTQAEAETFSINV